MSEPLSGALKRDLRSRAQNLEAVVRLGQSGASEAVIAGLDEALALHELVKLRFTALKDERHELAPLLAEQTQSHLIQVLGNVAVFYRARRP